MSTINISIASPTKLKKNKQSLYVQFAYNLEANSFMKSLKNRRYLPDTMNWEVPASDIQEVIDGLSGHTIVLQGTVETEDETKENIMEVEASWLKDFPFKTKPFQHQIEGMIFGSERKRFLLADDQGLGKTKQAIDLAVSRKGQFKHCLIVCGVNSVKFNWLKEIGIHSNETAHILGSYYTKRTGKLKDDGPMQHRLDDLNSDIDDFFLITNIETFRQGPKSKSIKSMSPQELIQKRILDRVEKLTKEGVIGMVVIDEIHKAKNPTSLQGKGIHRLVPEYRMALTGTPVMNSPIDVYNILKWLEVEKHTFTDFKNYYTITGGMGGYEIKGYKNLGRLKTELDTIMLRRKKEDVLDLPPKIHQTEYVVIEGSQAKLYREIRDEIIDQIEDISLSPNPLAMLTRLRQVTSYPQLLTEDVKESAKFERIDQMLTEMIEGGQKAIIFSNWSKVTKAAKRKFARFNPAYIDGEVKDRMAEVEKFQGDPTCNLIIGTIGAMGTGLTLTAASNVIFIDKPWTPADSAQAEDRAHRIGTKGTVNVISIIARDSVDQRIEELLEEKQEMIDGLVEGQMDKLNKIQLLQRLLE